jgi:hypothetical protein
MMKDMVCYICQGELKDRDLIIPLNVDIALPFGRVGVIVFQHYMCGIDHYFANLLSAEGISEADKILIEAKLMEVLNSMKKGTVQ